LLLATTPCHIDQRLVLSSLFLKPTLRSRVRTLIDLREKGRAVSFDV